MYIFPALLPPSTRHPPPPNPFSPATHHPSPLPLLPPPLSLPLPSSPLHRRAAPLYTVSRRIASSRFFGYSCSRPSSEASSALTRCAHQPPALCAPRPDHLGSSRIISDHPGSSRIISDHPGSSRIISDHLGSSRIISDHLDPALPRRLAHSRSEGCYPALRPTLRPALLPALLPAVMPTLTGGASPSLRAARVRG